MGRKRKLASGIWERDGVYYARFRARGRLIRKRLSTDYNTAVELLNDLKARVDRGEFGLLDNDYSIAELRKEYLRHCEQTCREKTLRSYRDSLQRFFSMVNATSVAHLSLDVAVTYRRERLAQSKVSQSKRENPRQLDLVSPRTVNVEIGAVAAMLNWAVLHRKIGSNPLNGLKPLAEDNPRKIRRALTEEEIIKLFDVAAEYLKPVLRMFACTGIRKGELVAMKFADIDFERASVTVHSRTAKSKKSREIPLDENMLEMLRELREQAATREPHQRYGKRFSRDHVFVTAANTPWRNNLLTRFYGACKKAGIDDAVPGGAVDLHSLRVTFCSLAVEGGASPKAVQQILGHSTLALTMGVYAKATERAKRDAISALPFAKSKTPGHVFPVQNEHSARTNQKTETQPDSLKVVG